MLLIKMMMIISLISMLWWRKHIMFLLLSLELFLMSLLISLMYSNISSTLMYSMTMLVMMASGSSLAISLLVSFARLHKSSSTSLIWNLTFDKNNYSPNSLHFIHP